MSSKVEPPSPEEGEDSGAEEVSRRVEERVPVEFCGRKTRGRGLIGNISESGALVEGAQPLIVDGGRIRLRFPFFEDSLPVEISATVVRETSSGFAVQFAGLDARTKSVLALVIARIRQRQAAVQQVGESR